jgi:hypothetical protein
MAYVDEMTEKPVGPASDRAQEGSALAATTGRKLTAESV